DMSVRTLEMDGRGDAVHVLSPIPIALTYWAESSAHARWCAWLNDWVAAQVDSNRPRFRGLAAVPLPDVPAAIAELRRAVRSLGLAGVEIGSVLDGVHLDDPQLAPFFAEAEALNAVVFVHPVDRSGA